MKSYLIVKGTSSRYKLTCPHIHNCYNSQTLSVFILLYVLRFSVVRCVRIIIGSPSHAPTHLTALLSFISLTSNPPILSSLWRSCSHTSTFRAHVHCRGASSVFKRRTRRQDTQPCHKTSSYASGLEEIHTLISADAFKSTCARSGITCRDGCKKSICRVHLCMSNSVTQYMRLKAYKNTVGESGQAMACQGTLSFVSTPRASSGQTAERLWPDDYPWVKEGQLGNESGSMSQELWV